LFANLIQIAIASSRKFRRIGFRRSLDFELNLGNAFLGTGKKNSGERFWGKFNKTLITFYFTSHT
jgi:hypothetical protein